MKVSNRNHCIDTIKGFACIAVVLIHYNWSEEISLIIKTIGRFAVPFFFFVSGYYLPDKACGITRKNTGRKIKHILSMACKSAIFYWIFCVYWNSIMDKAWNLWTFTVSELNLGSLIKFVLSSDPFVYAHFWYLIALVSCYLVVYFLCDRPGKQGYLAAFIVLLCGYSLLAEFRGLVGWKNFLPIVDGATLVLSNIFLFRAMPFFLYGIVLRKYRVAERRKMNVLLLLALVAAGCALCVIEERRYGTVLMYVGNHLMVIALSLICIWYPEKKIPAMEYIGDKLSMYVYIYHIAVGKMLDLAAAKLHLWNNGWYKPLRPLIVLAGSLLVAQLLVAVKDRKSTKLVQTG